jgi:hypothetical protein
MEGLREWKAPENGGPEGMDRPMERNARGYAEPEGKEGTS